MAKRLGLIGCGGMGLRHAFGYIELKRAYDSFELIAVCDRHEQAANHVADAVKQATGARPTVHLDYAQMLEVESLDAIDITTDTRMHHTLALAAFERGIHVLTEKPMGLTLAACRKMAAAAADAKAGRIDAIVTAPINKTSWKLAGERFPGHTEWLADEWHSKRVTMAFVGGGLRIALASAHLGLFELRSKFSIGLVFQPIDLLNHALVNWFDIPHPRIAVAGLNPHAGEGGRFGDEEARVIEPAIQMARNQNIDAHGPFPADTLFTPKHRTRYDGFVAMYHDQGLIPIKMLAFDTAVNVSLGLPIVRTSPDHGTAFDIAGTNQADPGSMKEAIRLACQLAARPQVAVAPPSPAIAQK